MKIDLNTLISESILDAEIDPLNEAGIFNASDANHVNLFVKHLRINLREAGVDTLAEGEFCTLDEAGKYPDRQAYNKEGWLVTFPSKEYKDRAIKKGTHYASDPTHGKGGMNLYYKSKGKQKRQTQQDTTSTDAQEPEQKNGQSQGGSDQPSPSPQGKQAPSQGEQLPASGQGEAPQKGGSTPPSKNPQQGSSDTKSQETGGSEGLPPSDKPTDVDKSAGSSPNSSEESPQKAPTSAPAQQLVAPKTSLTIDFAKMKGWSPTPYGEWRDQSGTVVAVVSLSGEVAPIASVIRDELKLFASRKSSNG